MLNELKVKDEDAQTTSIDVFLSFLLTLNTSCNLSLNYQVLFVIYDGFD